MSKLRKRVGAVSALAALAAGLAFPSAASAHSQAYKSYTWNTQRAGDCTMFKDARWTLYPNGTAHFDGTVRSSADNDAWLMWAYIEDKNNAVLGQLTNSQYQTTDQGKFVKNLYHDEQNYRWLATGRFDSDLYPLIHGMSLKRHC